MSRDQNAGPCHNTKTDNRFFERMVEFNYLGTNLTNKVLFRKKLRACLNWGIFVIIRGRNFYQVAIQKFKVYGIQNYNFACCFYGCGTWSLTMREENRLRVFENRVLRRILGLR